MIYLNYSLLLFTAAAAGLFANPVTRVRVESLVHQHLVLRIV